MTGKSILFVDYENVRDSGLEQLQTLMAQFQRILLFVGHKQVEQGKPPAPFIRNAMKKNVRLDLIPIEKTANNNLDFHIAYYLGRVQAENPHAPCIVFTGDGDLQPLILHLQDGGFNCTFEAMPRTRAPKPARAKPAPEAKDPVGAAMTHLKLLGARRPKTKAKLAHRLESHLHCTTAEAQAVIGALAKNGIVAITEKGAVTYKL